MASSSRLPRLLLIALAVVIVGVLGLGLVARWALDPDRLRGVVEEQLTRVLDLLHKRFAESLRVEDLCSVGNLSPRSLHRLFARHVGENVSDYLGRLRIGRACMLLVETDRPISVIAPEAGFSNLSNFNRRFLEARGMTPREFRRFIVKYGRMPDSLPEDGLTKRSPSLETRAKRLNSETVFAPGSMPPSPFVA